MDGELEKRIVALDARIKSRAHCNSSKFISECLNIQTESAQQAGEVGYMARVLVQATLPHSQTPGNHFKRTNGSLTVELVASSKGLPYGSYPRLLLAWVTTEAVRTKSPTLQLGDSLSQFMANLGLSATGGRWGSIPRLKDQALRLFGSFVTAHDALKQNDRGRNIMVADEWDLWWDPAQTVQQSLFGSWVKLTDRFFNEVTERPVPLDMRAIRALKKSPLALDIYAWATYRASYLPRKTPIKWESLQQQFGSGYPETPQGKRNFKKSFLETLRKVGTAYPDLRSCIYEEKNNLVLMPMSPHVRKSK